MASSYNALARQAFQRASSARGNDPGIVKGVGDIRVAFKFLREGVQTEVRAAIAETTQAVTRDAQSGAPVSDPADRKAKHRAGAGELRDTIRDEYSADGFTGFVKAGYGKLKRRSKRSAKPKKQGPERYATFMRRLHREALAMDAMRASGVYAMVVEYGDPRRNKPARPFMRRALSGNKAGHNARLRAALEAATRKAAQG